MNKYENRTLYLASWLGQYSTIQDVTIKILLTQLGYSEIFIGKLKQSISELELCGAISLSRDITPLKSNDVFTITLNKDHEIYTISKLDRKLLEKVADCDFLRKDNLFCVTLCLYELIKSDEIIDLMLVPKQIKEMSNLSYGSVNNCLYYIRKREIL